MSFPEIIPSMRREIDAIVYRLFDLAPAEIAIIETALTPVHAQNGKKVEG